MTSRALLVAAIFLMLACQKSTQEKADSSIEADGLYELALTDLPAFAQQVAGDGKTTYDQAQRIVTWFARNFDWTATDYQRRTVEDILLRKGGNCNELAMVTTATMQALDMKMRKIREINLHVDTPARQDRAEAKVREIGPKASVFGRRHNDHVWIEIHDTTSETWFPADPSLGIIGKTQWLQSRFGFGERYTLDPTSEDMIAPFAIFATDDNGKIIENRTSYYVVDGFNEIYGHALKDLSPWQEWTDLVDFLDDRAREAFEGTTNLHQYGKEIARLGELYGLLKSNYQNQQR